jgi:hypothetical protein
MTNLVKHRDKFTLLYFNIDINSRKLKKQLQAANERWSSKLGVGRGANNYSP